MKKTLALILSIVMMLSVIAIAPIGASAAEVDSADTSAWYDMFEYQLLDDGTAEVLHYYGYDVDVVIPSYMGNVAVTSINEQAFRYSNINTVSLPTTLKTIESLAFASCSYLQSINIPANVTYIAPDAFSSCYNVKSITVDRYNSVYDSREDCNAIIEKSTNTILRGCDNSVIPDSVEHIGYRAFERCYGLDTIILGENVKTIGKEAFLGCTNLSFVELHENLQSIGEDAFNMCYPGHMLGLGMNTEIYDSETTTDEFCLYIPSVFAKSYQYIVKYHKPFETSSYGEPFVAVGSESFFGSNWDPADMNNELEYNFDTYTWEKTYKEVKAGTYEFKVTTNGTWNEYEFNLDGRSYSKPNSTFKVEKSGSTVIIGCDASKAYIEIIDPEKPSMVTGVKCTNIKKDEFTVEWNENYYVDTYYVYVDGQVFGSTKEASLTVPNREKGRKYNVQVIAKLTDGSWLNLDLAEVVEVTTLNKVENLRVLDATPFEIEIEWDATPEAIGYWVYTNDGAYKYTTDTTMTVTKRVPETLYNIFVTAVFDDNFMFKKENALVVTVTTDDLGPITSTTRYDFPFDSEVKSADKAWILYGKSADKMVVFNTVDLTKDSFRIANLDYDTDYYYGFMYMKNGKAITTTPKCVHTESNDTYNKITATVTNEGKLVLNWNQVNQAHKYWVFRNGGIIATPESSTALTLDKYNLNDEIYIEGTYRWQDGTRQFKYEAIKLSDILK